MKQVVNDLEVIDVAVRLIEVAVAVVVAHVVQAERMADLVQDREAIGEFEAVFDRKVDGAVVSEQTEDAETILIASSTMAATLRGGRLESRRERGMFVLQAWVLPRFGVKT